MFKEMFTEAYADSNWKDVKDDKFNTLFRTKKFKKGELNELLGGNHLASEVDDSEIRYSDAIQDLDKRDAIIISLPTDKRFSSTLSSLYRKIGIKFTTHDSQNIFRDWSHATTINYKGYKGIGNLLFGDKKLVQILKKEIYDATYNSSMGFSNFEKMMRKQLKTFRINNAVFIDNISLVYKNKKTDCFTGHGFSDLSVNASAGIVNMTITSCEILAEHLSKAFSTDYTVEYKKIMGGKTNIFKLSTPATHNEFIPKLIKALNSFKI